MLISVVIPAFNEEAYLGETLASLNRAKAFLQDEKSLPTEIIVVDNDSDDSTAEVARAQGATVARETFVSSYDWFYWVAGGCPMLLTWFWISCQSLPCFTHTCVLR